MLRKIFFLFKFSGDLFSLSFFLSLMYNSAFQVIGSLSQCQCRFASHEVFSYNLNKTCAGFRVNN